MRNNLMTTLPDFIVLALIYAKWIFPKRKTSPSEWRMDTLIFLYLLVILDFTFFPVLSRLPMRFQESGFRYNFVPFIDWTTQYGNYRWETFGNILLFIPWGLLWQNKTGSIAKAVLAGFATSFLIEFFQPLISSLRICDITDLINNTAGTLIGACVMYLITLWISKKKYNKYSK